MRLIFYFIPLFMGVSCIPQGVTTQYDRDKSTLISEKSQEKSGIDLDLAGEIYRASGRSRKISSLELEDPRFGISYLTPSLQEYLDSETLLLTFERPLDSDYVEILRCESDVIVDTGIVLIDFKDWSLNGMSEDEKTRLYNTTDVFKMASAQPSCTYVNAATVQESIPDAWASSDSYRYLAVACVAPNRLTDTELTSRRNCSKRFAISPEINYVNARKEEEKEAIQALDVVRSSLDITAATVGEQAFALIEAMDACEQREYDRAVDTQTKNSVLQIIGAAGELVIELTDFIGSRGGFKKLSEAMKETAKNTAKKVGKDAAESGVKGAAKGAAEEAAEKAAKNFDVNVGKKVSNNFEFDGEDSPGFKQTFIDTTQLGQAMEGMTFTRILTNLFADASDMPRSCETALSRRETLEITMNQILILAEEHAYLEVYLEQVRSGLLNQAGVETEGVDTSTLESDGTEDNTGSSSSGGLYDD